MKWIKGYRFIAIVRAGTVLLCAFSALFLFWIVSQVRGISGGHGQEELRVLKADVSRSSSSNSSGSSVHDLQHYAVIWGKMDMPPRPEPEPAPASEPEPDPDPYPNMKLTGVIVDSGGNYAVIRIEEGATKIIREGKSYEDIKVRKVTGEKAIVEVDGRKRELTIVSNE